MASRYEGPATGAAARTGLNQWIGTFAGACMRAAEDAASFENRVEQIESRWRAQVGQIRNGSATDLPSWPGTSSMPSPTSSGEMIAIGEVKSGEVIGGRHLAKLRSAIGLLRSQQRIDANRSPLLLLFSGAGFTPELGAEATSSGGAIQLVGLDRLYSGS